VNQQGSKAYGAVSGTFPTEATVSTNGYSQVVSDGQQFTLSGSLGAETTFDIAGVGSVSFHTSCSVPLNTGDRYGPFTVLGGGTCAVRLAPVPDVPAGGVSGCCYSYTFASVGVFVYGSYLDTTINQCLPSVHLGGGSAFEAGQTCASLESKHNSQKSGCCFEFRYKTSLLSTKIYTYADAMESDCMVTNASAASGVQFELGTSCSDLKLRHEGANVRCQTCDSSDDARPTMLTFKYVGGSALTNPQNGVALVEQDIDPVGIGAIVKCYGCSGGVNFDRSSVQVYAELNAEFTVGLGGDQALDYITTCEVHSGAQLGRSADIREHTQTIKFATACHYGGSINVGDIFGSIQLTGYRTYDSDTNTHVSGPGPGTECGILTVDEPQESDDDKTGCVSDICASLAETGSGLETLVLKLNFADARVYTNGQGGWNGGKSNKNSFFEPTSGSKRVLIRTAGKTLRYRAQHADGELFEISAAAYGLKKLGKQITFIVGDTIQRSYTKTIKVNTGCSHPLAVGDKFGVLEVVGYVDTTGKSCGLMPAALGLIVDETKAESSDSTRGGWLSGGAVAVLVLSVVAVVCFVGVIVVYYAKPAFEVWHANAEAHGENDAGGNNPLDKVRSSLAPSEPAAPSATSTYV
jgi:hypothetical protein